MLDPGVLLNSTDLSKARGQAHLRHAMMSDRNFVWARPLDPDKIVWRWELRFYEATREAIVMLSDDLQAIGKRNPETQVVTAYSCAPMTLSLRQYFGALGLLEQSSATSASTQQE